MRKFMVTGLLTRLNTGTVHKEPGWVGSVLAAHRAQNLLRAGIRSIKAVVLRTCVNVRCHQVPWAV